nr:MULTISPECIES: PLP-dependent aminotransferase family protein [Methylotenera]
MKLQVRKSSGVVVYLQIAQQISDEIQRGRLAPSTAMPGTRELATKLNINRKTVILAYEELIAQGWLTTESRRGTFVSAKLPHFSSSKNSITVLAQQQLEPLEPLYEKYFSSNEKHDITQIIDFNDGIPDSRLIPFETLSKAFRHALIEPVRANKLGYGDPKGNLRLREALSDMLNLERGLNSEVDNICITRGSQMGIFLAARVLVSHNDYVVFEELSYPPAREAFRSCGAKILSVGIDRDGLDVEELEALCKLHKIRAIYVTPHHQFPTTVMMTAERRMKLVMLAEKYDFVIVEDDYDHEFHFHNRPVFPLASTCHADRIIYVGSLSKVLAPGLRVGYLVATKEVINACSSQVMLIDRQGNSITELAVAALMESGEIKRHIRRTLKTYNERRNFLMELLQKELGDFINFNSPNGGLAIWLKLNETIDIENFTHKALEEKVKILPASLFSHTNKSINGIRLGFGSLNLKELELGTLRLKHAFTNKNN